jgi:beta-lactam-binding protein with PASTA domain
MKRSSLHISYFFWILPFLCFVGGYAVLYSVLQRTEFAAPNVVGKSLHEATKILSAHRLNVRLRSEHEDAVLAPGTVMEQIPRPFQKVRPNQNIFVTLAEQPHGAKVSMLCGMSREQIELLAKKSACEFKILAIPSHYPDGLCFAQSPQEGEEQGFLPVIAYVSAGRESSFIVPNLRGAAVAVIQKKIASYDVDLDIFHNNDVDDDHQCNECIVMAQSPMPGSIVDMAKRLMLQVQVHDRAGCYPR